MSSYTVMERGYVRIYGPLGDDVADLLKGEKGFTYRRSDHSTAVFVDVYPNTLEDRDFLVKLLEEAK